MDSLLLITAPTEGMAHCHHRPDAIRVQAHRGPSFSDRGFPITTTLLHERQHGVRHRILLIEQHRSPCLLETRPGNLRPSRIEMLGKRKTVVTGSKVRIKFDSAAKQVLGDSVFVCVIFVKMPQAALIGLPHVQAPRRFA
jgi:hypothetical protein